MDHAAQPIGKLNHKETMSSYYSVADYTAVKREFGEQADFERMVKIAHPDWYTKDVDGKIVAYNYDNGREIEYWTDVVVLDYTVPAVLDAQSAAMRF